MMKFHSQLFSTLCMLFVCSLAFAQPANNVCTGSVSLTSLQGGGNGIAVTAGPFDNTMATSTAADPATGFACFGEPDGTGTAPALDNTLWFSFVGDGGLYSILTTDCGGTLGANYISDGDTQIAIYTGACGALVDVACNEDIPGATGPYPAGLDFQTTAGVTYYMLIDGFNFQGTLSTGQFCVQFTEISLVSACTVGNISPVGTFDVCPGGAFTVTTDGTESVPNTPTTGGYAWLLSDASGGTGGLAGGIFLTGQGTVSIDEDLGGLLSANMIPPLGGTWVIYHIVYADATDTQGTACGISVDSTVLNFIPTGYQITTTPTFINETCSMGNGSATVVPAGGASPYTYQWNAAAANQTTQTAANLSAGTYTVLINDACGTSAIGTVMVGDTGPAPTVAVTSTPENCGGNDGSATASVTAGNAPYSYAWSNGANTAVANNLAAGSYSVVVSGANGCMTTETVNVGSAGGPNVTVDGATGVTCAGMADGTINITVVGGVAPYTFVWSNGSADEDLTGLPGGTYSGTVTDASGCTFVASNVVISDPAALGYVIDFMTTVIELDCAGDTNGAIAITTTGGTPPYTFSWSNGAATEDIVGLAAGTYSGTITDANGCTLVSPGIPVSEPAALGYTIDVANIQLDCFGDMTGEISITTTGGTTPYTYAWSNGSVSEDIMNLGAGTYSGTITDANGCVLASPMIPITAPAALAGAATVTDEMNAAGDGAVDFMPSGGTMPYTFAWSNGESSEDLTNVAGGSYTVVLTDANNCTESYGPYVVQNLVGTEDNIEGLSALNVQPNPTSSDVQITLELDQAMDVQLAVYSLTGQQIESFQNENITTKQYEISLADYPAGIYLAKLTIDNQVVTRRIVLLK